jgi:hypothetical protein
MMKSMEAEPRIWKPLLGISAATLGLVLGGCSGEAPSSEADTGTTVSALTEARKTVLVAVHPNPGAAIAAELATFAQDLTNEGWTPMVETVALSTPAELRAMLASRYASTDLAGVVFVGDLPQPRIWHETADSAAATGVSDLYYMDLDGTWTDQNQDGYLDWHGGHRAPEIFAGRIKATRVGTLGQSEVDLLRAYFARNHAYRTGATRTSRTSLWSSYAHHYYGQYDPASHDWSRAEIEAQKLLLPETRVLVSDDSVWPWTGELWPESQPATVFNGEARPMMLTELGSALDFANAGYHGWPGGWDGSITTSGDVVSLAAQGAALPVVLDSGACSTGDITVDDSIAQVFSMAGSLAVTAPSTVSSGRWEWNVIYRNALAAGYTVGQAVQIQQEESMPAQAGPPHGLSVLLLLGDPTIALREHSFVNPRNLRVYVKDEGSNNQSTALALYVRNLGWRSVSNFKVRYSFNTAESLGKAVALQDNYTPWSSPSVGGSGTEQYVEFDFTGCKLRPGRVTSGGPGGGEKIRVHFTDWATTWSEANDFSAVGKAYVWGATQRVDVLDANNNVIYGYAVE